MLTLVTHRSFHDVLETWQPLADWLVAVGTIGLAAFTAVLARQTKNLAAQTRTDVGLEQQRVEAAQRPIVLPAPPASWTDGSDEYSGRWAEVIPVTNAGPGAATHVRGTLIFAEPHPLSVDLVPAVLGAGDNRNMRLNWTAPRTEGWDGAVGYLVYTDIADIEWRTDFAVRVEPRRAIVATRIGKLSEIGQPEDVPPMPARGH